MSKLLYWIAGLAGAAAWTGFILQISNQPLPVELALGGMALVACAWGHSVLFPVERSAAPPAPMRRLHRDAGQGRAGAATRAVPASAGRQPPRPAAMPPLRPGELPPLLRVPFEEAARMEARRLGEALTSSGLFGPVAVRLEPDGSALVSPVLETLGVRLPAEDLVRFAALVTRPDSPAEEGRHGAGSWPGPHLASAIAAHLAAAAPAGPPARPRCPARGGPRPRSGAPARPERRLRRAAPPCHHARAARPAPGRRQRWSHASRAVRRSPLRSRPPRRAPPRRRRAILPAPSG